MCKESTWTVSILLFARGPSTSTCVRVIPKFPTQSNPAHFALMLLCFWVELEWGYNNRISFKNSRFTVNNRPFDNMKKNSIQKSRKASCFAINNIFHCRVFGFDWSVWLLTLKHLVSFTSSLTRPSVQTELEKVRTGYDVHDVKVTKKSIQNPLAWKKRFSTITKVSYTNLRFLEE